MSAGHGHGPAHHDEGSKRIGLLIAILALVLAFAARQRGDTTPDATLKAAFANLWQTQETEGEKKGSWAWLDFGLEPWESPNARYYGACLAAIAVGTAPGDFKKDPGVALLRTYLNDNLAVQSPFNKAWALIAAQKLDNLQTPDEQKKWIDELFARQQDDGGWNLASLGPYKRKDKSEPATASDAYATAIVLNAIGASGDPRVAKGLAWLRKNQEPTGEWRTASPNKQRDFATHTGKFLSDAATAYAVIVLTR